MSEWDELAGLRPTAGELDDLIDVLAEVDAGDLPGDGEDYGPWDYSAELAGDDYTSFADVAELANGAVARESVRADEDAEDAQRVRPGSEDVLARAMDRIARGTYLPGPMYRDRDEAGRWAAPETACAAHRDDFGRCAARYHDAACLEVARGSAATSDAAAVEAWNRVLRSGSEASAALLANRTGQDWDEALAGPGPGSADVLAYMREQLGIGGRADLPQPARLAAGSMAGILGLE